MDDSLVSRTRIFATEEAHKYYDYLCKGRQVSADIDRDRKEKGWITFTDTPQAFYVAAVVGHMLQNGERYSVSGKKRELLLRAEHWERMEKTDLRRNFTYLAKLEYNAREPDDILQVVAELAERGIRHIWEHYQTRGTFDFTDLMSKLRESTKRPE